MLSSLLYLVSFSSSPANGFVLTGMLEDQLKASNSSLQNMRYNHHPDDGFFFPDKHSFERFRPDFDGDPRFPIKLHPEQSQSCVAAMVPGVPAVVYLKDRMPFFSLWEAQYLQDLLRSAPTDLTLCEVSNTPQGVAILGEIFRQGKGQNSKIGFIFNSNELSLDYIANVMDRLHLNDEQPTLLIHLADEWGQAPPGDYYKRIVGEDGLVLRQYHHQHYHIASRPVVLTMPLGYTALAPVSANSCEASQRAQNLTQRDYEWAFIGTLYDHRVDMVNTLSHDSRFREHYVGNLPAEEMLEVYKNSVFVPVGRGHISLDCFRIYESIISGAIPVVVASAEEISSTFVEHGDIPMVVASDWGEAAELMSALLGSPDELRTLQTKLSTWICETVGSLQTRIADTLKPTSTS